jgi:hypothetical protein
MKPSSSPVIIGGNGGSGTRVVAEVLIRSGAYLGYDLNEANDNLLFTYLFKRSQYFSQRLEQGIPGYQRLLGLHERLLFAHPPGLRDGRFILSAGLEHAFGRYGWRWVLQRWSNMIRAGATIPVTDAWGWKEPNSMFFLREIREIYPEARIILVLRNGLDMAYSGNSQQVENWGPRFQIDPDDLSPANRFEYWYRSNREAIETLGLLFGDDFLIVRFEELCLDKSRTLQNLIQFAGLDYEEVRPVIWGIPQLPDSYHRYLRFETSWIDQEIEDKLAENGYPLNRGQVD